VGCSRPGFHAFHGIKVQHVIFADGMVYVYAASINRHDSRLLDESDFMTYFTALSHPGPVTYQINGDQAHKHMPALYPRARTASLRAMPPAQRAAREATDKANNGARIAVEQSFATHVQLFPHAANYKVGASSQWAVLHAWLCCLLAHCG